MSKRMSFKVFLFSLISIFAFSTAYGQDSEYKEYTVIKGDTLWDISSKEVNDAFLWPKIWKENPDIANPDKISPGQIVRIPLRLIQKEQPLEATTEKAAPVETIAKAEPKVEEPQKETARKIEPETITYLADKDLITAVGYITDYIAKEIKSLGRITGSPTGRTLLGKDDLIYIKTNTPANIGDKFYIIRSDKVVKHPVTKNKLGHLIEVVGVAEVIGPENSFTKAKVAKSYVEIKVGDLLEAYYEVEPVMRDDNPRKPDVAGVVIATRNMRTVSASMDVIFLDKGSNSGLEVGDILKTVSYDKFTKSRMTGVVQIISLKPTTAAAIVNKSESIILVGDSAEGIK